MGLKSFIRDWLDIKDDATGTADKDAVDPVIVITANITKGREAFDEGLVMLKKLRAKPDSFDAGMEMLAALRGCDPQKSPSKPKPTGLAKVVDPTDINALLGSMKK